MRDCSAQEQKGLISEDYSDKLLTKYCLVPEQALTEEELVF